MKKQFFAAAMILALGAGMTACSSDDLNVKTGTEVSQKATTYMAISFAVPANNDTRAGAADGQDKDAPDFNRVGQWEGQDQIEKVSVYVFNGTTLEKKQDYTNGQLAVTTNSNGQRIVTPNNAFRITPGTKTVYVVLNPTTESDNLLNATEGTTTLTDFKNAYESKLAFTAQNTLTDYYTPTAVAGSDKTVANKIAKVKEVSGVNKDVILMTGPAAENQTIADNVTEAQAVSGASNRVNLTVKRAVARVFVTSKAASFDIKGNDPETPATTGFTVATVSDLSFVVAQGESSLYFQQKLRAADGAAYDSPAFDKKITSTADYWDPAFMADYKKLLADYDYAGLWKNTAPEADNTQNPHVEAYKTKGIPVKALSSYPASSATGKDKFDAIKGELGTGEFLLPTVHAFDKNRANTGYQTGNTAYILVRGHLSVKKYVDDNGQWSTAAKPANQDWFLGANGIFYTKSENAVKAETKGVPGQTVRLYKGGKVLYTLFVNPDDLVKAVNSPVTRNNIYHVQISGIGKIGANWNPLVPNPNTPTEDNPNPNNPNNPDDRPGKGDNPNEPTTPPIDPKDPLSTLETWMSVNVMILPWQVHSYEVTL